MNTTDTIQETDDLLMAWAGFEASHRWAEDRFTTQDLIRIAHEHGYTSLNSSLLWVWVHRGLFPPARERLRAKGQPGVWYRTDVVRLLDLCSLLAANSRGDAAHLGLWLLGYDLANVRQPPDIRRLFIDQIERIERSIYGQVMETNQSRAEYEETTLNALAITIEHVVEETSNLEILCSGLHPPLHEDDLESLQELHPDICDGATLSDLQQATLPSGAIQREELQQVLEHNVKWNVPGIRSLQNIHNALASVLEPPASPVTSEQRIQLQRSIIGTVLWSFVDMLPHLRSILEEASETELRQARLLVEHLIIHVLGRQRVFPDPGLTGLKRMSEEYHQDSRRLFAAPAFFPELSYLIALQVYDFRQSGSYAPGQLRSVQVRPNVVTAALDQLARLSRESTSRAEAFLAVIFSAIPISQGEVSIG